MSQNGLSLILLAGLVVGVIFLLQWVWRRPLAAGSLKDLTEESGESEVTARPLMSPEEATLFNMVKLTAQDHFLVLAKIPILSVVSFIDKDEQARKTLMRSIQSLRLDVVLAHPGTLTASTVVKFQRIVPDTQNRDKRDRVVHTVLKAAGIKVIVLDLHQAYSVAQLTELLGLGEEE